MKQNRTSSFSAIEAFARLLDFLRMSLIGEPRLQFRPIPVRAKRREPRHD